MHNVICIIILLYLCRHKHIYIRYIWSYRPLLPKGWFDSLPLGQIRMELLRYPSKVLYIYISFSQVRLNYNIHFTSPILLYFIDLGSEFPRMGPPPTIRLTLINIRDSEQNDDFRWLIIIENQFELI